MKCPAWMLAGVLVVAVAGAAHAASWTLEPSQSKLGFTGTQSGAPFSGRFKTWTAAIDFDPAKPEAGHVLVTIDIASATTDDPQKDQAMPQPEWFDAAHFAQATFEATGFKSKGGNDYETAGTLTLRGVSREVTLPFTLTVDDDEAHAVGSTKLVRTDFGVGQGAWSDGQMVGLDVAVNVDLVAAKK